LRDIFIILDVIDVNKEDIFSAMDSSIRDFEDALVSRCADKGKS
jgi:hypothetical protein